jgi:hypothetical protein
MCRNIKPLFNFDPQVTDQEIHDAALQFVRKISGYRQPSRANQAAFEQGVGDVAVAARTLLQSLATDAHPHDREIEAARARQRAARRFA